ncbi:MAG: PKD domain-containing protein [Candidatus Bathyarchaeota archaeon]|nr:PKD domain-containing protein [Candidatus Bathyarchaeota archaeon]
MEKKAKTEIILTLLLIWTSQTAFNLERVDVFSEAPLADQINACLREVTSWKDLANIGVVMHKSSPADFDTWITSRANAADWEDAFAVKRYAEQAGYSSSTIDAKVKLALSNIPMFNNYSLPKTDTSGSGYFWPWERYVLYGYRYAEELNWETGRWNKTSGFLALKSVRDWYGRAFYRCNPDIPVADSLFGTRWHQAGSLMDSFFIFYEFGVKDALDYAVQEWRWLNNRLWANDHFNYAPNWSGWEVSGISVFPNVAKLHSNGTSLGNWSRVMTDLQFRYISSLWGSPQWHGTYKVAEHHHPRNPERRLDGTLDAWIMLNTFCGLFNSGNRTNMKNTLEGNGVTQAWVGLNASDLRQTTTNLFRLTSSSSYSDSSTASAALSLFLMGISPQDGRGLAIPLISDRHSDYASLNYRHFEFDYTNHKIKIPVWGGTTLKFMYGKTGATEHFETTGIYNITFTSDWNSISQVEKVSNLYSNEYYLWAQESSISSAITILSPENKTYSVNILPLTFTVDETTIWMGYSLDGQANVTITGDATLPVLSDGSHHLIIYANDTFDNMGSSTVYFTVDTTPPTIIILSPENKTYSMDAISLTFTVSESTSWIGYSPDGQANTTITGNTTLTGLSDEMHNIRVYARDIVGNTGSSDVVYFTVDATPPTADAGSDQTVDEDTAVTFDGSASTDNVGIVSYEWDFGDGTSGTSKTVTHEYTNAGTYTVTLKVEDAAGNQATDTVVVTVNSTQAFPWWIVAAAVIIAAGIVAAAVILWRRRRKTAG